MNVYEPVGVVSAISAYNFPFYLNVWKTLPALMAGCSLVLRPSPLTPLSAMLFGEAADAAGLPPGVLNVVIDQAIEGGKLITTHPAVDMVTFTGSTQVGREIMAQAASTVKKVHLELGGKSAAIYLPDAAENAWHMCLGVFMAHQGQGCALTTRILVPHDRKAEIMERAAEFAAPAPDRRPERSQHHHGSADHRSPGREVGALRRRRGRARREGRDRRPAVRSSSTKGHFFEPTLLDVPDNSNPAAQDEIFGPVASVIGYDDVDDAVRIANDSIYGLAGMVFGDTERRDEGRAADPLRHGLGQRRGAERVRAVRRLQAERCRARDGRARLPRVPGDQAPLHRVSRQHGTKAGPPMSWSSPTTLRCLARRPARMSGSARTSTVRFTVGMPVEAVVQHDDRARLARRARMRRAIVRGFVRAQSPDESSHMIMRM